MGRKRLLSLLGSAILCFGTFTPALSVPVLGNISYFACGKGDGTLIIALSLFSVLFALKNRYQALWYTGLASAVVVSFTYADLHKRMAGIDPVMAQSYQLSWGWAVLIVGMGTLLAAAALKEKSGMGSLLASAVLKEKSGQQPNES